MKKNIVLFIFSLVCSALLFSQGSPRELSVELTAVVQKNPALIKLKWRPYYNTTYPVQKYNIYRKFKTGTNFNSHIATLNGNATEFIDSNVSPGISYEYFVERIMPYNIGHGYINSGIDLPVVENRGNMILLVDNTFSISLASELTRLENDLEGDGWNVIRHDVSRTDSVPHIKSIIVSDFNADPVNTKALFLFGHVPVPYSGYLAPDGHGDHAGAWSTDTYYGDVDGVWTDHSVSTQTWTATRSENFPGDGRFDQNAPDHMELQVGRVDLWGMNAFTNPEQKLLQNYLDKDHEYRNKKFTTIKRGIIDDNFGYNVGAMSRMAYKNFSTLIGYDSIYEGDYTTSMTGNSYQWSYGVGGSTYTRCGGVVYTVGGFDHGNFDGVFTILMGSYFGDFDIEDNVMRAALAQGHMLTSFWGNRPEWLIHHMAMGENIGYSARLSQNNDSLYFKDGNYPLSVSMNLMGDPSLRTDVVSPVSNVIATTTGNNCNISWTASPQAGVLGYNVYMKNDSNEIYTRLNTNLITGTSYTDSCLLYPGIYKYMVRAVFLEVTTSGSYYNMSQGISDTALNSSYLKAHIYATENTGIYSTTFTATGTNVNNYFWDFGDGTTSIQQNPIHAYSGNGNYTVTAIGTNGCDADTTVLFISLTVGIDNTLSYGNLIHLSPNPASEKITVIHPGLKNEHVFISIYNVTGQLVHQSEEKTNTIDIDVSKYKSGLYFLFTEDQDKNRYSKKFIIQ